MSWEKYSKKCLCVWKSVPLNLLISLLIIQKCLFGVESLDNVHEVQKRRIQIDFQLLRRLSTYDNPINDIFQNVLET